MHPNSGYRELSSRNLSRPLVLTNGTRITARVVRLRPNGGQPSWMAVGADHAPGLSRWLQFVSDRGWWAQTADGRRTPAPDTQMSQLEALLDRSGIHWRIDDGTGNLWSVDSHGPNAFYTGVGAHTLPEHGWGEILYDAPTSAAMGMPTRTFVEAGRPHELIHQIQFVDYLFQNDRPVATLGWLQQEAFRQTGAPDAAHGGLTRTTLYLSTTAPRSLPENAALPPHLGLAKRAYEHRIVPRLIPRMHGGRMPEDRGHRDQMQFFGQGQPATAPTGRRRQP